MEASLVQPSVTSPLTRLLATFAGSPSTTPTEPWKADDQDRRDPYDVVALGDDVRVVRSEDTVEQTSVAAEDVGAQVAEENWSSEPEIYVLDAFPGGVGRAPNNPLTAFAHQVLCKGGPDATALSGDRWALSPGGRVYFQKSRTARGEFTAYLNPPPDADGNPATPTACWELAEGFSLLTLDVLLSLYALICAPATSDRTAAPLLEPVLVTADQILRHKGIRSRGESRRELKVRVEEEMRRLQALYFRVTNVQDPDGKKGQTISIRDDRLFDIVTIERIRRNKPTGQTQVVDTAWSVRAGQWAYYYLVGPDSHTFWVGSMARSLLELDHRDSRGVEQLAKKIGLHLAVLPGGTAHLNKVAERNIGSLLEEIGELPVPAARDPHWAHRTRAKLEKALTLLVGLGVFRSVHWPKGYGPEDPRRGRNWVAPWLAAKISFDARPAPRDAAAEIPNCQYAAAQSTSPELTEDERRRIRQRCSELGLSSRALAKKLGCGASTLSNVLAGRYLPGPSVLKSLRAFLRGETGVA